ncbi:MAG TPA: DUF2066 domain-containing protein [Rickettsiales bacterium]|nr:DUF2066 domain-containing protein [Rickettsiales bacterium]
MPAKAEEDPIVTGYSIENIVVDADGKDEKDARIKALTGGEVTAFKQFVLRVDAAKAPSLISNTSASQINQMISGFEVMEEKVTPNHYHGLLRYNFIPQSIQTLMPDLPNLMQTEFTSGRRPSKAVLVLPVYNEGRNVLKLWQDDNKWRTIWLEAALESGGGMVVVPIGDLNDRVDVDDTNVESATTESLRRMYKRYGVEYIDVLDAYFDKKADPKPTLEVTVKKLLPEKDDITHFDYIIHSSDTLDTLMARAANDIAQRIYKQQTIDPNKIEYERIKEIKARVNTSEISEWDELRKRLLKHGNIVSITMTTISFFETNMVISYRGTPDMLGKTLAAAGLRVFQDGDGLVLQLK